jgi:hypothetical protein
LILFCHVMKIYLFIASILFVVISMTTSCKKSTVYEPGRMQIISVKSGNIELHLNETTKDIKVDSSIVILFTVNVDPTSINKNIILKKEDNSIVFCEVALLQDLKTIEVTPLKPLSNLTQYHLQVLSGIRGAGGEYFQGAEYRFITTNGSFQLNSILLNGQNFLKSSPHDIDRKTIIFAMKFSNALDTSNYKSCFSLYPYVPLTFAISSDQQTLTIRNSADLQYYKKYYFTISKELKSKEGFSFDGFSNSFVTGLDSTPKFPVITDDELLTLIQQRTFRYFYDFADPSSGLARERNSSGSTVTIGGSGFGVMALIVGMNRGFISRDEGLTRLNKILGFLETCDRYHGAWPHWLNGSTGKTVAFTENDNGGDLVETSYMVQGLMTMRQYLDPNSLPEKELIDRIDLLTDAVEYTWYTRGENVLYWHWSPTLGWAMNMQIRGYNETLITYIVAATSTTFPITPIVYHNGYARNGGIRNGNSYYGITLPLGEPYGGPLFFTHYSFLGLDPRNLQDIYASYWEQNVNQSMINQAYCAANPLKYIGYGSSCWGLTASDNPWGYDAQSPTNDLGTITPTAAVSSLPYTPVQSMTAIKHFYYVLGDRLFGEYGFYDAFDVTEGWWADSYLAIDQGPIICMIENYRSGLLWNLFMSNPRVSAGLTKLGFTY